MSPVARRGAGSAEDEAEGSAEAIAGGNAEATADSAGRSPEAAEGLRIAAQAGVHRLAIPTPFQVGRVNAYLIEDEPLTLIDSGPNSAKALDELELALRARGHTIEEIGLLIVSHQHIDHLGLAAILARRSGAQVAALRGLDRYLGNFPEEAERDDRFAEQMMLRHGIPREIVTALRSVSASFRAWGGAVEVTRPLEDGERIELRDRTLTVLHRPGHSPSDTVFFDESRRQLLAADHLIAHISSNPLIA
ncbi:MAG: MBL fold metallo-hydrolase, partial [Solirubrobacterales bacterium]|nr:MBL fold metallo-hydrolase [Solirubrobacterales bacterium]